MEKYTKKATAKIFAEVLKVDPKAPKLTSLDQAYVILMTHWNMELSIYKPLHEPTKVALFRDDEIVYEWQFENAWVQNLGDFDWDTIYKDTLEDIIKKKLYKRPKLSKRAQKKHDEEVAIAKMEREKQEKIEEIPPQKPEPELSLEQLKKKRDNMSAKLSMWKKMGKDVTELQKEYDELKELCKKRSKTKQISK
jgi:hypothetical protein